jgi:DNA/RNA-binding domain of Phe-tRNA-synthetase-like protein
MGKVDLRVDECIRDALRLGVVVLEEIRNGPSPDKLLEMMEVRSREMRERSAGDPPSAEEAARRVRRLYHHLGIDPTKDRPSSERLLRMARRGVALPRVNALVDAMNLVSLTTRCPLGTYDLDRIVPPLSIGIGSKGDAYRTPSGDTLGLEGKLCLEDTHGLFGNPSHDAERAAVGLSTTRALVIAWSARESGLPYIREAIAEVVRMAEDCCSARAVDRGIVG